MAMASFLTYTFHKVVQGSVRHVWAVQPNRATDFRGPPFWDANDILCI